MVCIYCGSATSVTNSRPQKRSNSIWRRRRCTACGAVFTTNEAADYSSALLIQGNTQAPEPFLRDKLFISLLDALRKQPEPFSAASELTHTIISKLLDRQLAAADRPISKADIIATAQEVLKRFDKTVHLRYSAEHASDQVRILPRKTSNN